MSGLVSGLQNHVRQFESARHLSKNKIGTTLVLQLKNRFYYFIGDRVVFVSHLHNINKKGTLILTNKSTCNVNFYIIGYFVYKLQWLTG